jgi:hypothetical protein
MRVGEILVEDGAIRIGDPHLRLSFAEITEIAIYKRDEVVNDLICCDIFTADGCVRTVHEEMVGFDEMIAAFERLSGFAADWRETVVLPAFAENRRVVFRRAAGR